jgi:hypothetical protein
VNIKFKQPKTLDGKQLIEELAKAGIMAADIPNIDAEANLWIDIDAKDQAAANAIVAAHVANTTQPTIADKLALVGLSIDDLKAALSV